MGRAANGSVTFHPAKLYMNARNEDNVVSIQIVPIPYSPGKICEWWYQQHHGIAPADWSLYPFLLFPHFLNFQKILLAIGTKYPSKIIDGSSSAISSEGHVHILILMRIAWKIGVGLGGI